MARPAPAVTRNAGVSMTATQQAEWRRTRYVVHVQATAAEQDRR
ncbi:MAG: hypothetical protein WA890_22310 [Micromonospora sp.]